MPLVLEGSHPFYRTDAHSESRPEEFRVGFLLVRKGIMAEIITFLMINLRFD